MARNKNLNLWHHKIDAADIGAELQANVSVDFLIIGGGFTGCSAALEAAQNGVSVAVLEAASFGHGGSGRNAGLVNAGLWLPPDEIVEKMGKAAGMRLIEALGVGPQTVFDLISEHEIECDATRNGTLHLAHAPSGLRNLEERFRQGNATGAPLQLLDAQETARRTGSAAFKGALFDPRAGTVQPLAYCRGLALAASNAGAQLFRNACVEQVGRQGDVWVAVANGQRIEAKYLLLATNAYNTGIKGAPRPEFVTVSYSQFATAPLSEAQLRTILPGGEGCWDTAMVMTSVRLDSAGRMVIGSIGNAEGPGGPIHAAWARRKLASYYPQLADLPFEHSWRGEIAMTGDHIPKVQSFGSNAISVFGYSGRGISPGTVFGRAAARALIFDDRAALPVDVIDNYSESFKPIRAAYYETGAVLTHALQPNPLHPIPQEN